MSEFKGHWSDGEQQGIVTMSASTISSENTRSIRMCTELQKGVTEQGQFNANNFYFPVALLWVVIC